MRKTKIIATLGPATDSYEMLGRLIDAGLNIARLNMSHAPTDWVRRVVKDIREHAKSRGISVGILLDTQGPAIRTGDLPAKIPLKVGDRFVFTVKGDTVKPEENVKSTSVGYEGFADDVEVGKVLIVDNGELKMRILSKTATRVECEVLTEGQMGNRRHINLPGIHVSLPALTDKDKADIQLGLEIGVDFIALSFVREPGDMEQLRRFIAGSPHQPKLIAKIEHQFAVDHFEAIARVSDGVMVARGDLGIECPYEELPIIQRRIVKKCQELGRPVIVATQLLESMINNPMPTRAEITDVANATFEQADAIMLSGETTVGKYPLQCLEVFDTVTCRIERSGGTRYHELAELTSPRQKLVKSAVLLADELKAAAILVFTRRGHMARYVSWLRPRYSPIYAFADRWTVADTLTICRGVIPGVVEFHHESPERTVDNALRQLLGNGRLKRGDTVVVLSNVTAGDQVVDAVKMRVL